MNGTLKNSVTTDGGLAEMAKQNTEHTENEPCGAQEATEGTESGPMESRMMQMKDALLRLT